MIFNKFSRHHCQGALNTVGRYLVNMTRAQQDVAKTTVKPTTLAADSIPDALLTLTKNVLGENVTHTIEPLIKRVSVDETPLLAGEVKPLRLKQTRAELQLEVRTETLVYDTSTEASALTTTIAEQTAWTAQNTSGVSVVPGNTI